MVVKHGQMRIYPVSLYIYIIIISPRPSIIARLGFYIGNTRMYISKPAIVWYDKSRVRIYIYVYTIIIDGSQTAESYYRFRAAVTRCLFLHVYYLVVDV